MPAFPGLHFARGMLALGRGEPAAALPALQRWLELRPKDIEAIYYTAVALRQLSRPTEAEARLRQILLDAPDTLPAALMLAEVRLDQGDPQGAEAALRRFTASEDTPAAARRLLGQALMAQGRNTEAQLLLAVTTKGTDTPADQDDPALPMRLLNAGQTEAAVDLLRRRRAKNPLDIGTGVELVRALATSGQIDAARAEAQAQLERAPGDASALNALALTLALAGDTEAAAHAFNESAEAAPGALTPLLNLAQLALAQGDKQAARTALDEALARDPNDRGALRLAAALDMETSGDDAAAERLLASVKMRADDLPWRLEVARNLAAMGRGQAAAALLNAAPAEQVQDPTLVRLKALFALGEGDWALAANGFADLAQRRPDDAEPVYLEALSQVMLARLDAAKARLADALALAPEHRLAQSVVQALAEALPADARGNWLDELVLSAPEALPVLQLAAARALDAGNLDKAEALYGAARSAHPTQSAPALGLAGVARQRGDLARATTLAEQAVAGFPDDPSPRLALADLHIAQGQTRAAIEALEPLAERRVPQALNNLAWLLREQEPKRALALAQLAHRLAPAHASFADTLGDLLIRTSDPAAAVPLLDDAYARSRDPAIGYTLARALAGAGQTEKARRVLREVTGRDFPQHASAKALLESLTR
jgi:putative PEP-CTERM system TPR-repeat lipoprotein